MPDVGHHVGAAVVGHDLVCPRYGLGSPGGADIVLTTDEQRGRRQRLAFLVGEVVPVVVDVVIETQRSTEAGAFELASVEVKIGIGEPSGHRLR